MDQYKIELLCLEAEELKPIWLALEERSEPNFFLSWCWVEAWLEAIKPKLEILKIEIAGQVVGLGLLTCNQTVRHRFLRSRVLRLGQTGDTLEDQMWIEYNGLLLDSSHAIPASAAAIEYLLTDKQWDEFELGAAEPDHLKRFHNAGLTPVEKWLAPVYGADLNALRHSKKDYLASLSRNTRHQINRSRRLYESKGELKFTVLTSEQEIMNIWPQLASLHIAKWGAKPGQSGFANDKFVAFHKALVVKSCSKGFVEMCCLMLDDQLLGCLYNFLYKGRVYFYLSGLHYESDAKLKPGLLIHSLAIQHYMDRGFDYYDFLGGEARYKKSLGTHNGDLQVISFQRPRFKLKLEQLARKLKKLKAQS